MFISQKFRPKIESKISTKNWVKNFDQKFEQNVFLIDVLFRIFELERTLKPKNEKLKPPLNEIN